MEESRANQCTMMLEFPKAAHVVYVLAILGTRVTGIASTIGNLSSGINRKVPTEIFQTHPNFAMANKSGR